MYVSFYKKILSHNSRHFGLLWKKNYLCTKAIFLILNAGLFLLFFGGCMVYKDVSWWPNTSLCTYYALKQHPGAKKKQPTYKHFFLVKSPPKKLRRGLWAPYPYSQFISKVDEFQIRLSTIMDYNIVFHMCIEVLWAGFFDHRITLFHPVFCQIMCYYIIWSSM